MTTTKKKTIALVRRAMRARGWRLLHASSGFSSEAAPEDDGAVTEALVEIDAWDEPNLTLADAALKHRYPPQRAFVFEGPRAARGVESVLVVTRFLDRLDALERGDERKATRAADHAALATLAERGITPQERARMRALLAKFEALSEGAADAEEPGTSADDMNTALCELRAFYEEWSDVARIVVTRRDHLIRLGQAHRKAPAVARPSAEPAEPSDGGAGAPR